MFNKVPNINKYKTFSTTPAKMKKLKETNCIQHYNN